MQEKINGWGYYWSLYDTRVKPTREDFWAMALRQWQAQKLREEAETSVALSHPEDCTCETCERVRARTLMRARPLGVCRIVYDNGGDECKTSLRGYYQAPAASVEEAEWAEKVIVDCDIGEFVAQ